jgi:hypothetical protein
MIEIREVLRLRGTGLPKKRIAAQLGLDPKTVRRYLEAAATAGVHVTATISDEEVRQVLLALHPAGGRPRGDGWARCVEQRAVIERWLGDGLRLTKIRKLLVRQGIEIAYPTLHRFAVLELQFGKTATTIPVLDGEPGHELQLDTGWVGWLTLPQGKKRRFRSWIFTAVRSRHRFVYPAFEETTARAIEACEAAWAFFGGVFRVLIPDNTKAIIVDADPLAPRITPAFLEYAQARHFHIDPARVRSPRDKAYASLHLMSRMCARSALTLPAPDAFPGIPGRCLRTRSLVQVLVLVVVRVGPQKAGESPLLRGGRGDPECMGHFVEREQAAFTEPVVAGFEVIVIADTRHHHAIDPLPHS